MEKSNCKKLFGKALPRIVTVRDPYIYNISHSYSPSYRSKKQHVPGLYEYYYNEDKIIHYLLHPQFSIAITQCLFRGQNLESQFFLLENKFCFWNLYQHLKENNLLNDSKYLEVLSLYLEVFDIIKTDTTIGQDYFKNKCINDYGVDWQVIVLIVIKIRLPRPIKKYYP